MTLAKKVLGKSKKLSRPWKLKLLKIIEVGGCKIATTETGMRRKTN